MQNKIIKSDIFQANVSNKTNWLFIKLENKDNLIGWGEATLAGKEQEVMKIKESIFDLILDREYNSPYDFKKFLPFNNIIEASISSSIMQCLWDIEGKKDQKSISEIFGTKNKIIQTYANFNRSTINRTIEGVRSKAKEVLDDGFTMVKFAPFDEVNSDMKNLEANQAMSIGLERINVIRETLGPDIAIMIDCHERFNYNTTLGLIKECEQFNLHWIEGPIIEEIENIDAIKKIRLKANNKGIKLAGLEKKVLKEGFYKYLKAGAYDTMMPDIKYAGGPDELLDIEKLFTKYSVEFSPHNPSGPIAHAHTLQICSSSIKDALMEYQYKETNYFDDLLEAPNPEIISGKSTIPEHINGLGVAINELQLKRLNSD